MQRVAEGGIAANGRGANGLDEGGQMRMKRKKADGSRIRYQHGPYDGTG